MSLMDRISAAARALGDEDLAAMSNRGLVRRARKDVATAMPTVVGEESDRLVMACDGALVRLAIPLTLSRCDCPETTLCRHVLACLLAVAGMGDVREEIVRVTSCGQEVSGVDDESLRAWAGKELVERATRELVTSLSVECTDGPAMVARMPQLGAEARWIAGGGLSGMVCTCHAPGPCVHKVIAVLGWQVSKGQRTVSLPQALLEASTESPRTRDEVCAAIRAVCTEIVANGFAGITRLRGATLRTLSVAAHGVDLPRLEGAARIAADRVEATLKRNVEADDTKLLASLAAVYALATALKQPTDALVGQHRARYSRMPTTTLTGVGLNAWRSTSGFRGLTAYFWNEAVKAWCTWSESRPAEQRFDPVARAGLPGPWNGCESPMVAGTWRGTLADGWSSGAGRLSGRSSSRYAKLSATTVAALPRVVESWSELPALLRETMPAGFAIAPETAGLVLIRPRSWDRPVFDEIAQELRVRVWDGAKVAIELVLPQSPETKAAIIELERMRMTGEEVVFARLISSRDRVAAKPLSILGSFGVRSLGLGVSHGVTGTGAGASGKAVDPTAAPDAADEQEAEAGADGVGAGGSGRTLSALRDMERLLVRVSALGLASFRDWDRFDRAAIEAEAFGMGVVAESMRGLAGVVEVRERAERVLRAAWVVGCAGRLAAAAGMCGLGDGEPDEAMKT